MHAYCRIGLRLDVGLDNCLSPYLRKYLHHMLVCVTSVQNPFCRLAMCRLCP